MWGVWDAVVVGEWGGEGMGCLGCGGCGERGGEGMGCLGCGDEGYNNYTVIMLYIYI